MSSFRPLQLFLNGTVGGRRRGGPPFFPTKKLAVIGSTAASRFAPWHDPSWTIATHTCSRKQCGREPDWYFDLHRPECFKTQRKAWNPEYYTWLQNLQTPIFMQQAWPEIPMAVAYPLDRILSEFRGYLTNHVAFMIALAMTEGVTTLGVFGCEYQNGSEYAKQRGSLEYWLGRFEQWGGKLVLPHRDSALLSFPRGLYGYESHDANGRLCGDYKSEKPSITVNTADGGKEIRTLTLVGDKDCPPECETPIEIQEIIKRRSDELERARTAARDSDVGGRAVGHDQARTVEAPADREREESAAL